MGITIDLYSNRKIEIKKFLNKFYEKSVDIEDTCLKWELYFENPVKSVDIIGTLIDNNDKYKINMWVSFDTDFFLNVTDFNSDKIIRYIFERYPY